MTEDERVVLRHKLAEAVLEIQDDYVSNNLPDQVIPELIAALVSLAAFITQTNTGLSREMFLAVCRISARIIDPRPTDPSTPE